MSRPFPFPVHVNGNTVKAEPAGDKAHEDMQRLLKRRGFLKYLQGNRGTGLSLQTALLLQLFIIQFLQALIGKYVILFIRYRLIEPDPALALLLYLVHGLVRLYHDIVKPFFILSNHPAANAAPHRHTSVPAAVKHTAYFPDHQ